MFIIFDLDDTLIDTSACITPFQLEKSLRFAKKRGLALEEADCNLLLKEHVRELSCESAFKKFLEFHGASSSLILEILAEYRTLPDADLEIPTVPYAVDVLKALVPHRLAVVTIGREELQHYKLKKAGIFLGFFSKIVVTAERNKKIHYESLLEEYGHLPEETVVVGDRIEADLMPAKELGCRTVRLMRGRGAYEESPNQMGGQAVDFTIHDLRDLPKIIERI